jgi:transposase-like protein
MESKAHKHHGRPPRFSDALKREVVLEYYSGKIFREELAGKYGISPATTISSWVNEVKAKGEDLSHLPGPKGLSDRKGKQSDAERIKALERQLSDERLKTLGLETMIDIAEKELKIDIRKKSVTKQSKP